MSTLPGRPSKDALERLVRQEGCLHVGKGKPNPSPRKRHPGTPTRSPGNGAPLKPSFMKATIRVPTVMLCLICITCRDGSPGEMPRPPVCEPHDAHSVTRVRGRHSASRPPPAIGRLSRRPKERPSSWRRRDRIVGAAPGKHQPRNERVAGAALKGRPGAACEFGKEGACR